MKRYLVEFRLSSTFFRRGLPWLHAQFHFEYLVSLWFSPWQMWQFPNEEKCDKWQIWQLSNLERRSNDDLLISAAIELFNNWDKIKKGLIIELVLRSRKVATKQRFSHWVVFRQMRTPLVFFFSQCQTELSQVPTLSDRGGVDCTTDNTGRLYQETQETIQITIKKHRKLFKYLSKKHRKLFKYLSKKHGSFHS